MVKYSELQVIGGGNFDPEWMKRFGEKNAIVHTIRDRKKHRNRRVEVSALPDGSYLMVTTFLNPERKLLVIDLLLGKDTFEMLVAASAAVLKEKYKERFAAMPPEVKKWLEKE